VGYIIGLRMPWFQLGETVLQMDRSQEKKKNKISLTATFPKTVRTSSSVQNGETASKIHREQQGRDWKHGHLESSNLQQGCIFYEDGHDQVEDPKANQHEHAYIADLSRCPRYQHSKNFPTISGQ